VEGQKGSWGVISTGKLLLRGGNFEEDAEEDKRGGIQSLSSFWKGTFSSRRNDFVPEAQGQLHLLRKENETRGIRVETQYVLRF